MLLALTGVAKSYGSLKVIDELSLGLARGEALGVIGPNGAGKTTLLNLIGGNTRPDAGRMAFDGRDITRLDPAARCRAGHRPLLPDPASVRRPDGVRERAGRRHLRHRARRAGRHAGGPAGPAANRPARQGQPAGRLAAAAGSQAPGTGARARHRTDAAAARRDRRRPHRARSARADRLHPRHPRRRRLDDLDRAHRARPDGRGGSPAGDRLRPPAGGRRPRAGDGEPRGARDLHGHRGDERHRPGAQAVRPLRRISEPSRRCRYAA